MDLLLLLEYKKNLFFIILVLFMLTTVISLGSENGNSKLTGNRLKDSNSPYLLMHADNPVDWYPWGEEAFKKARQQNKPIFLSIGYSTCHWCHVMEHESFEAPDVAKLMNDTFISIKVDREQRPDIDNVYMKVCQMMNEGGCGWPLTILMTPDKKPFFATTYIPKNTRFGRTGLMELIPKVQQLWENERDQIINSSNKIANALKKSMSVKNTSKNISNEEDLLNSAYTQLRSRFDNINGGFGKSPKFPTPQNYFFLLRYWKRNGNDGALQMVDKSLKKMREGGIYDHIGFGFHRYSTDQKWLVPHFEKMLYDQAMLSMVYVEAYLATKDEFYSDTAREIFDYVIRDMTDKRGGFYTAQDADSAGKEGAFYLWSEDEIKSLLHGEDQKIFLKYFNIREDGNFKGDPGEGQSGKNILFVNEDYCDVANELGISKKKVKSSIEKSREELFAQRENRVHPNTDDKVLADMNGLMIASLAKGAQAFNDKKFKNAATGAAEFIIGNMITEKGKLFHRYRDGKVGIQANIDDYAFMIFGLNELYEATLNEKYLKTAIDLNQYLINHFWDETDGGFFYTPDYGEKLLVRNKEFADGAIPSGNSVEVINLLRLGRITANTKYEKMANDTINAVSDRIENIPSAYTMMLSGLTFGIGPSYEVVIVGNPGTKDTKHMLNVLRKQYVPEKVVIFKHQDQSGNSDIVQIAPFTKSQKAINGKATAYVCQNFKCNYPTTSVEKMVQLLNENIQPEGSDTKNKSGDTDSKSLLGIF